MSIEAWIIGLAVGALTVPAWADVLVLTHQEALTFADVRIDPSGRILPFKADGEAAPALPTEDVLLIRFDTRPRRAPARAWVFLQDGQRLSGESVKIKRDEVTLISEEQARVNLDVEDLAGLFFHARRPTVGAPPTEGVRVLRADGDELDAPFAELTEAGLILEIDPDTDPILLPFKTIGAVIWSAKPSKQPNTRERSKLGQCLVELRTGERIRGTVASLDDDTLTWKGDRPAGPVPAREVSAVWFGGSGAVGIDVPSPEGASRDARLRYRKGRNGLGGPLRIGPRMYDQGVGLRGPASVQLQVPERARWFLADVGADADAARFARITFEVLADGEVRARETNLVPGQAARPLAVPVRGAKRITLRVSPSQGDATGCLGDFGDAMFIR